MNLEELSADTQSAIKHAIAVSWCDEDFADMLRNNPHKAFAELGYNLPPDMNIVFD